MNCLTSSRLFLLGGIIAIGPLTVDMYLPSFPAIEAGLKATPDAVELTLASYFIGLALGQLVQGPLSDRFGRRRPLLLGMCLFALASLGCAWAGNVTELAAWRFLQALGASASLVIVRAVVRDSCDAKAAAKAFSNLMLVMGLAPMLAPMLGGWLVSHWDWRAIFDVLAGYGLLCLLAAWRWLPETHDSRHAHPLAVGRILGDYRRLLASRAFMGYSLMLALPMAGMFAYIAGSPFVLMTLHDLSAQQFSWAFGVNVLGFVLASRANALALQHHQLTELLRWALWVPALAGLALTLLAGLGALSLPLTMLGFFLYVGSLGLILPNASAAAMASHGQMAGTASAMLGAIQFAMAAAAGGLVSLLHDGSPRPLMLVMALCGVAAWLVRRWLVAGLERHPPAAAGPL